MLVHLAQADLEERKGNYEKVREIFEKCLEDAEIIEPTLIWIHYIRFVRRIEGLQAARKLFKRAREDPRCKYHLYIANADLEYLFTKDEKIGFKIFLLGAKKFSNESEYMLAYLKYMAHLNEDNNSRVLFERILNNEDLPIEKSNEIWSEFLKFECAVGDLASILKVDKKRQKVFAQQQSTSNNDQTQNAFMIDRYKFLDLLPCSFNELKSMGYKNIPTTVESKAKNVKTNLSTLFSSNIIQKELAIVAANEIKRSKFPVPDVTQMLPFKPIRNTLSGLSSIAGGMFPFPPVVNDLVKRLPPPNSFLGPFVIIDKLIKVFQEAEYVEEFQSNYVYINGEPIKELEHLALNMPSGGTGGSSTGGSGMKRPIANGSNSDDEDTKKGKIMDIYKQRQYKKLIQK